MELYLQFGWGMMEHCRLLIKQWSGGTVILSPRDLTDAQLRRLSGDITAIPNGKVLLDPQFYFPRADHERLRSHSFWPNEYETNAFWRGPSQKKLLTQLSSLNSVLATSEFIVPGLLAAAVDDDWIATQTMMIEESMEVVRDIPILATIALSADALRNQDQVALLIERSETWAVGGYYLVCEHPNGKYLVDDPLWLANVLDLIAALRLREKSVVVGYCNHQMLIAGCAKATGIASGTWMNVRSFPPDKFRTTYEEEIKQRATWYYCPQALSEYKIPYLDFAHQRNLLDLMRPEQGASGDFAKLLFSGPQPSSVGFTEQAAFRHYLASLRSQVSTSVSGSFDETIVLNERLLDDAEDRIRTLSSAGVRGQLRDFQEIVDVNRAALEVLKSTRGPILRRSWNRI